MSARWRRSWSTSGATSGRSSSAGWAEAGGGRSGAAAARSASIWWSPRVPVIGAGGAIYLVGHAALRDPAVVAWATIGFGVLLYGADRMGMTIRRIEHMTLGHALVIGLFQVLALIPGASRSGVTMTAARWLGYERPQAARFAMLMSIPVIAASGAVAGYEVWSQGDPIVTSAAMLAAGLSFGVAMLTIAALLALLRHVSFTPFVVYRLALGGAVLVWLHDLV